MGFLANALTPQNSFQAQQAQTANTNYSPTIDAASQQALAGNQQLAGVNAQLQGIANGTGPNVAQAQLNQATGQNVATQSALQASNRGANANAGLVGRQASQSGGNLQQQAVGQAATNEAQQQQAALGQLSSNTLGQMGANTNLYGAAVGGQNAQNNTAVANLTQSQNTNANVAAANTNAVQSTTGGIYSSIGSMLTAPSLAHGGQVQYFDDGGSVDPTFAPPSVGAGGAAAGVQAGGLGGVESVNPATVGGAAAGATLGMNAGVPETNFGSLNNSGFSTINGAPSIGAAGAALAGAPQSAAGQSLSGGGQQSGSGAAALNAGIQAVGESGSKSAQNAASSVGSIASIAAMFADGGTVPNPISQGFMGSTGTAGIQQAATNAGKAVSKAHGGQVPVMLSPGEKKLSPQEAKAVAQKKINPMSAGEMVPGKAKVAGDSLKNDIVKTTAEPGSVIVPRSKVNAADPVREISDFVAKVMAKHGKLGRGGKK